MTARRVVIGVGNEFRKDDGVGPAVITALAGRAPDDVALVIADGEPTALLDAWADAALAVVVDAAVCEPSTPGRVHRVTADGPAPPAETSSTHGLGVPQALQLADALGRAPERTVIFTVEAADVGHGVGLSPEVLAALPAVVDAIAAELDSPG